MSTRREMEREGGWSVEDPWAVLMKVVELEE